MHEDAAESAIQPTPSKKESRGVAIKAVSAREERRGGRTQADKQRQESTIRGMVGRRRMRVERRPDRQLMASRSPHLRKVWSRTTTSRHWQKK